MIAKLKFSDPHDFEAFKRYIERAKAQDGTVSGLHAGLMCSAVKRAKVSYLKSKKGGGAL